MKLLTDEEILAVRSRFKKLANSSTKRTAEGMTLANSPLHMRAFTDVVRAQSLASSWEGTREDLDARLKEMEDSVVASLEAGDALLADFPPGTGNTFGYTSGTPSVEDGACACHKCGEPVHLSEAEDRLPAGPDEHVFLKLETGRDVLLFVMHPKCFESLRPPSEALNASRKVNAGLDFVEVDREEWVLLLTAKTVLSS